MNQPLETHLLGQSSRTRASFWHEVRALPVLDLVPVSGVTVVADLGAGAGLLGRTLRRQRPGAIYRFYEPLDPLADHLVGVFGPEARLDSGTTVAGSQVVTLLDVVEHVEDDRAFLSGIIEAMDDGARLVVTVPALPVLWSSWDEQLGHHRRYTRASLRTLAAALDLDVIEVSYLFPELVPPALVRKVLRRFRSGDDGPASDFPELPRPLDRILRSVSTATYRLRRIWPFGSSLVLVGSARPARRRRVRAAGFVAAEQVARDPRPGDPARA